MKHFLFTDDVSESDDANESGSDGEDLMSNDDLFKIPRVPNGKQKKSAKKSPKKPKIEPGTLQNGLQSTSNRGRKRFVPIALKTCSQCGQEFADHAGWSKVFYAFT